MFNFVDSMKSRSIDAETLRLSLMGAFSPSDKEDKNASKKKFKKVVSKDLHLEKLEWKMTGLHAMEKQLFEAEQFLINAKAHGAKTVYLIHGLGEGKLKNSLHQKLKKLAMVQSFDAGHHPKYGFGATKVVLK